MLYIYYYFFVFFFFFSSRRRHTRLVSDWSSDVCSSDLFWLPVQTWRPSANDSKPQFAVPVIPDMTFAAARLIVRSEERRVGKECRYRWSAYDLKKKKGRRVSRTMTQIEIAINECERRGR